MTTSTCPANPSTPARSLKVTATGDGWLMVAISDRGTTKEYLVRPLPDQAWAWQELQGEDVYEARLAGQGSPKSCTCKHGRHRGQGLRECRHVAATAALVARGRLS